MFENAQGAAVLAAKDLDRAKRFYEGVLGLTPEPTPSEEDAVFYRLGGVPLMVYVTSYAGTAQNTVFAIDTDDLERDMAALREKGVTFMDYDFPGLKTVNGVAQLGTEKASWFADSEGNIISLGQRNS